MLTDRGFHLRTVAVSFVVLCLLVVEIFAPARQIYAQVLDRVWQAPVLLAQSDSFAFPKVAADGHDRLHLVWSAWTGSGVGSGSQSGDTIYYSWWGGVDWSTPIDVVVSPQSALVIESLLALPSGSIVVLWMSEGHLYISSVQIGMAERAANWQTSEVPTSGLANSASLAVDQRSGRWHLVYADRASGSVYAMNSDDAGKTWDGGMRIWETDPQFSVGSNVQVIATDEGFVHYAWVENVADRSWSGVAIYHAVASETSLDEVTVREVSRSLAPTDPTQDWPTLLACGGEVHLFWNNGVGSTVGRYYQTIEPNGAHTDPVQSLFAPTLSGQTGNAGMACDSLGRMALVTSADDGIYTGFRFAMFALGQWSTYLNLWGEANRGEHPSLAIVHGNQLHLVWGSGGSLWHASGELDAPFIPSAVEQPTPVEIAKPTVPKNPASSATMPSRDGTSYPFPRVTGRQPQQPGSPNSIFIVVFVSLAMVVVVVGAVLRSRKSL